eukprot:TRINITY_DN67757_c0_g2_i1.p4 TRINITY_DN67757_c0_g2~~TRINITY_DN67757_c0_g2_i1.p4  ORF type:complete len:115 (-),score=5.86 TRINITY_DN67757_c0_g2_i1:269-613(-)
MRTAKHNSGRNCTESAVSSGDQDHPGDGHIEEPYWVDSKGLPIIWHELGHEAHRGTCGPCEAHAYQYDLQPYHSNQEGHCGRYDQRAYAVPKDAHRLEERYAPPQQQGIECHNA